jgi:hypothetical protein
MAVERRYPDARAIVELGGQDAKIVVIDATGGRRRKIVSLNDKCAGGTGIVIDKIAAKLKIPEAAGGLRTTGADDLPHRRQVRRLRRNRHQRPAEARRAARRPDGVALRRDRGAEPDRARARAARCVPRVVLLGGPHAFIPRSWRPGRSTCAASGTSGNLPLEAVDATPSSRRRSPRTSARSARSISAEGRGRAGLVSRRRGAGPPRAANGGQRSGGAPGGRASRACRSRSSARVRQAALAAAGASPGSTVDGFIGLDAGSTSTKAVVLDEAARCSPRPTSSRAATRSKTAMEMFRALRDAIESQRRAARGARPGDDRLRQGHPEGGVRRPTRARRDRGARAVGAPALSRSARDRRRRRAGHQDHRAAQRPREGLPAEHAVLGRQRLLPPGDRRQLRLPGRAVRGPGVLARARCRSSATAACCSSSRRSPTCSGGAGARRRCWPGLAAVLPKNVFLYVAKAPNLARLGRGSCCRAARSATSPRSRRRWTSSARASAATPSPRSCCTSTAARRARSARGSRRSACGARGTPRRSSAWTPPTASSTRAVVEDTRCHFCTNECLRTFIDVWTPGDGAAPPANGSSSPHARRARPAACRRCGRSRRRIDATMARTPNLVRSRRARCGSRPTCRSCRRPSPPRAVDPRRARGARRSPPGARAAHRHPARVQHVRALPRSSAATSRASASSPATSSTPASRRWRCTARAAGRGAIDPCFPSKVALAHVHDLLHATTAAPLDAHLLPDDRRAAGAVRQRRRQQRLPDRGADAADRARRVHERPLRRARDRVPGSAAQPRGPAAVRRQMLDAWAPAAGGVGGRERAGHRAGVRRAGRVRAADPPRAREALDALERDGGMGDRPARARVPPRSRA